METIKEIACENEFPDVVRVTCVDGEGQVIDDRDYVPERTCHMTLKKSGPFYDVWHFDCCDKEWSEPRCDDHYTELPGTVCPWCGAKVVE